MSDKIIHLTDDSFDTDVLKADGGDPRRFLGRVVRSVQNDRPDSG